LAYGISTGGNINIALWEARPIFYLFAMLILASNLLEKPAHVNHLMWSAVIALFIEGLVGCYYYFVILNRNLADVEAITEHSAAIHMNTVFVFMLAVWVFKASA